MFPWMVICRLWIRTRAALNHCILVCRMSCSPQTRMNVEEMAHGGWGGDHQISHIFFPPPPNASGPPPPEWRYPPPRHGRLRMSSVLDWPWVRKDVCVSGAPGVSDAGSTGHRAQPGTISLRTVALFYMGIYRHINVSYRVGWDKWMYSYLDCC